METSTLTKWGFDVAHSEINFKVKHMMVSTVSGTFKEFEGSVETEGEGFENAQIAFSAKVESIDTRNEQRDGHLKSDDFFNAAEYPSLSFQSTSLKKVNAEQYALEGNLTIRDVTKPVTLEVEYFGTAVDPYKQTKAGFEITGKINRKDFNLNWSAVTEAGNVVVSDTVKLDLNVQLIQQ